VEHRNRLMVEEEHHIHLTWVVEHRSRLMVEEEHHIHLTWVVEHDGGGGAP
jgi:hypothetical protein